MIKDFPGLLKYPALDIQESSPGSVCVCVCVCVSVCVCVCVRYVHSVMSESATPWTIACQSPLSMEFSKQEYWSGLPFPTSQDLPYPRIEPVSLASLA